ncbi:MAG TPA: uroporphyrinogen-III synthase [Phnomibacter sp.]|nr:uroporphyrinogen-III synthase [Phnomibacter sp.]
MKPATLQILSTRPLGQACVAEAGTKGIQVDEIEFIKIVPLQNDALQQKIIGLAKQNIVAVFTSMNAVQSVADMLGVHMPAWRIACLSQSTKLLVEALFPHCNIIATGSDAVALVADLLPKLNEKEVHFFCSNIRRDAIPQTLQENGVQVNETFVYETHELPMALEKQYDAVLFFSPSAVRSFFAANTAASNTVMFATGPTTAAEIQRFCHNEILQPATPGKDELIKKMMNWAAAM